MYVITSSIGDSCAGVCITCGSGAVVAVGVLPSCHEADFKAFVRRYIPDAERLEEMVFTEFSGKDISDIAVQAICDQEKFAIFADGDIVALIRVPDQYCDLYFFAHKFTV